MNQENLGPTFSFRVPPKPASATFWMIWSPQGVAPNRKHEKRSDALTEANRLAKANPSREFYVLQALAHIKMPSLPDPVVTDL